MAARIRAAVLVVLALLVVVVAWTSVALLQARSDVAQARTALAQARDAEDRTAAASSLAEAERELRRAAGRLQQPGPRVAAAVPLAGRSIDAAGATAQAGAVVADEAGNVLSAVPDELLVGGQLDLQGVSAVEQALRVAAERTQGPVARLVGLELAATPAPLADGVREAQAELADVPTTLGRAADALGGLRGVLGGERERRLLIILQNNAELRATGGLVSVFAEATARDGAVEVAAFREVEDVAAAPSEAELVPAPDDYRALFAPYKAGTTLWKNVNMAPDVPTSSGVLAAVARESLGEAPDAIVWLDVPAIAAVLRATGPVSLPDGSRLSADDAVPRLLSQAYEDAGDTAGGQQRRREELRAAADAVLGRLLAPGADVDAVELARQLGTTARGRHLAVWSSVPEEQRQLVAGGAAGAVAADDGDLVAAATHNLGDGADFGNKLDFYSRRLVSVRVEVGRDAAVVEQELTIRNTAPASGLPFYVAGLRRPGVLNQLVTLAVPADAELELFRRGDLPIPVEPRPLGDHVVVLDAASLPPGRTMTWHLRYRLPVRDGQYRLRLFPQPLAVDAGLSLRVQAAPGLFLQDGALATDGPFQTTSVVDVVAQRPSWTGRLRDRVRALWNEPVPLP